MRRKVSLFSCVALLGVLLDFALADVTRFELSGTVKDATGAVLPGVTLTLKNVNTGLVQTAATSERGTYFFPPLDPSGRWTLSVELSGFKSELREGLVFKANTKPTIDFSLELSTVQETVTVTAESPIIETRVSELAQSVGAEQVEILPNNARNFLNFVELSGAAVSIGEGSGSFSFNGQGRRMGNFISDGVSMTGREIRTMNGEFGGGNGLSLDVISEIQVISNGFKAEVGNTGAGTVSIVTRSGTNRFQGSAYTYQKPSAFVANDQVTGKEFKQKRQQYGVTFSGPLVKDRTHFFVNWESNRVDDQAVVTSVLDPGVFKVPQSNDQIFLKVDHQISPKNLMDIRFNWYRGKQEGQGVGGLSTYERRSNTDAGTTNIVGSLVSIFGSNKINELRVRWTDDAVDFYSPLISDTGVESRHPDFSRAPGPTITRPGVGNSGPAPSYPQNLIEKRFQVVDSLSIRAGTHDVKFGTDVLYSDRYVTFFSNFTGTYTFATGTPYPYDANNPATFPFSYTQNFGNSDLNFNDYLLGVFAQDDWEIATGLTLNLGVRYDYDNLFDRDKNNFAPRLGFAWDIGDRGETVVRGSFGIFYDTMESSLINRESNFGPVGQFSMDLRQGSPLFPQFPDRYDSIPEGAAAIPRAVVYIPIFEGDEFPYSVGNTVKRVAPYIRNYNFGVERQLRPGWAVSADLTRVEGRELLVTLDANAPPFFALAPGHTRTQAQADALRPYGSPGRVPGPYGVEFGGFRTYYMQINGGSTDYWAVRVGLEKRFADKYGFQVRYTWSRARGDVDNFRNTQSFVPGLNTIDGDRSYQYGVSETDVPHFFVANGIYEFPWEIRVSGILRARSGFPYTGLAGYDADGDGFVGGTYGDRNASLSRNSFRMDPFYMVDAAVAKGFAIGERMSFELRLDIFNIFNTANTMGVNSTMGLNPAAPAANFGNKTSWSAPRQAQIALRFTF